MAVPAQIPVKDANGLTVNANAPLNPGRALAAESRPVAFSTEDLAAITALHTDLVALEGYVDGLEALIGATNTKLDTLNTAVASTADSNVEIHQPADVITFTPTLDTAIYASGDVLFATAAISGFTRANDLRALLTSLTAIDKSKQKPAMTLFFYQTNVTSAAANAANNLSDADAINCLGYVRLAAADWIDLANNSFLCYSGPKAPNLLLEAASGTTTVYVVGILDAGTPTFAVGDLVLKLGVVQS